MTTTAPNTFEHLAIYDWRTWRGFLLPTIVPGAQCVDARPGESTVDVLSRVPSGTTHFAFHLCVSRTHRMPLDREYLVSELRRRGLRIVNERVTDVTKRHIQATNQRLNLVTASAERSGALEQRLIVKSNYNYGAEAERRLGADDRTALDLRAIPESIQDSRSYRVAPRCEIADSTWDDESVVVERFIENPSSQFFRVYVSGPHVAISTVNDPLLFKKMPVGIERRTSYFFRTGSRLLELAATFHCSQSLLSTVGAFVDGFGLDFGALDVVHELPDTFCVIDVNNTPHWGDGGHPDLLNFLRQGLFMGAEGDSRRADR